MAAPMHDDNSLRLSPPSLACVVLPSVAAVAVRPRVCLPHDDSSAPVGR